MKGDSNEVVVLYRAHGHRFPCQIEIVHVSATCKPQSNDCAEQRVILQGTGVTLLLKICNTDTHFTETLQIKINCVNDYVGTVIF